MLFCVVGYLHPPDRYTAYLKYVSSEAGKWNRGDVSYSRMLPFYHVSQVENTYKYLKENHPEYLYRCPVRSIQVSTVPVDHVKRYYRPRERLREVMGDPKNILEENLLDLVTILTELSGIDVSDMGVTGSILTSTHSPEFSDIDFTVYGMEATRALRETMREMRRRENVILPFSAAKNKVWSREHAERFPLSFSDLMEFSERRWNYGIFRDTYFSIHPIRTDREITEKYGDQNYTPLREVTGRAVIKNSDESIYLPAVYHLESVESENDVEISRVVSYESLYSDMFEAGERVAFHGKLEKVEGIHGDYHQVVIGGAGSKPSYIKRLIDSSQP